MKIHTRLLVATLAVACLAPADLSAADRHAERDGKPKRGLFQVLFGKQDRETRNTARSSRRARDSSRVFASRTKPQAPPVLTGTVHESKLANSNRSNTNVVIDISKQRAYLLVDGEIAVSTPVSTARPGKYTPRGTFYMTERVRSGKVSNIYHVGMPYWMRLGSSAFGVHAGYLPGYPASAGCVRLPYDMARVIYDNTRSGTKVSIYSSWSGSRG